MAQHFYSPYRYSPFSPFGAYQPEEELLYPEQGMQYGYTDDYLFGAYPTDSGVDPTISQPAAPEIPQGAPGSPQAFFEEYRSQGPLTPEQISRGEAAAARMGRTFDPDTGFSQATVQAGPAAPVTSGLVTQSGIPLSEFLSGAAIPSAGLRAESPMYADDSMSRGFTGDAGRAAYEYASAEREGRPAARMQQPGETITERDTRVAGERTTGPRTYGGYTTAQLRGAVGGGKALRAAQMQAEMQGKQAEAEYLQEQQMAAQEAAYKQQQSILESELKQAAESAKPSDLRKAIDEVNSLVELGAITEDQSSAALLSALKYDPGKVLGFDDITKKGITGKKVTEAEVTDLRNQGYDPTVKFDSSGQMYVTQMGTFRPQDADAGLTSGQDKLLEEMAKSLSPWYTGGRQQAEANLNTYDTIVNKLTSGEVTTRNISDLTPEALGISDLFRQVVNPSGQEAVDRVRQVVFQGLKDTLGAQFTQREAERLVSASYNPALDEATNIARLKDARNVLSDVINAKNAFANHIASGGGPASFEGLMPSEVLSSGVKNIESMYSSEASGLTGFQAPSGIVITEKK